MRTNRFSALLPLLLATAAADGKRCCFNLGTDDGNKGVQFCLHPASGGVTNVMGTQCWWLGPPLSPRGILDCTLRGEIVGGRRVMPVHGRVDRGFEACGRHGDKDTKPVVCEPVPVMGKATYRTADCPAPEGEETGQGVRSSSTPAVRSSSTPAAVRPNSTPAAVRPRPHHRRSVGPVGVVLIDHRKDHTAKQGRAGMVNITSDQSALFEFMLSPGWVPPGTQLCAAQFRLPDCKQLPPGHPCPEWPGPTLEHARPAIMWLRPSPVAENDNLDHHDWMPWWLPGTALFQPPPAPSNQTVGIFGCHHDLKNPQRVLLRAVSLGGLTLRFVQAGPVTHTHDGAGLFVMPLSAVTLAQLLKEL